MDQISIYNIKSSAIDESNSFDAEIELSEVSSEDTLLTISFNDIDKVGNHNNIK